jgi:hypothetical protein
MAWIESHDTIWEHHKTIRLCAMLNIGRAAAIGHLHGLWHFVLRNAWKDANLEPWGDAEIERAAWWEGEKGACVKALREVGFLDGFVVHDWVERAGRLVGDRLYNEQRRKSSVKRPSKRRKPLATLPYPTLPNPTKPTTGFDGFWNLYPKRVGRGAALKAWNKITLTEDLVKTILAAVKSQTGSVQWQKENGQYIPHPATWLNQERWLDDAGDIAAVKKTYVMPAAPKCEICKKHTAISTVGGKAACEECYIEAGE